MSHNPLEVVWVEQQKHFEQLVESWQACEYLAIDTEFERRTTYYPLLALVQICDGQKIYLIDPLKVKANSSFQSICSNPQIIKIMHSAREDLEVFQHAWACEFRGLFDTQLAYAFLSANISIGYAALVNQTFDFELAKQATLSDWMQRPLSKAQLDYAAEDVAFLPELYQQLDSQLETLTIKPWFARECNELCASAQRSSHEDDYRGAVDAWLLESEQLSLFKFLYQWRQQVAETDNKPVSHIYKDNQLVAIVSLLPKKPRDFYKVQDLHPRSIRLYSQTVIDLIESFKQPAHEKLKLVINPRDLELLKPLSEHLSSVVKQEAKKLDINSVLLMSKRQVKRLAYAYLADEIYPELYQGWRGEILKPVFASTFENFNNKSD